MISTSGLDLGQTHDSTALAVLEHQLTPGQPIVYHIRHLQRWPLGTAYPVIVDDVAALHSQAPLADASIVVDGTGAGRPVVDLFRRALWSRLKPVTITAGHQVTQDEAGYWHVPKRTLVAIVQTLLQTKRLRWAAGLREAKTLERELRTFRIKVTAAANDTYGAWREGEHDDLILAVALAAWYAEQGPTTLPLTPKQIAGGGWQGWQPTIPGARDHQVRSISSRDPRGIAGELLR